MSERKPSPPRIKLRILATADVHMHLVAEDEKSATEIPASGLAWTASLIRQSRREAANSLLVDNGDFLHGNPIADMLVNEILSGRREQRGRHPFATALRALNYDAITLGNHDFDHGAEFLGDVLNDVHCPVLASNLSLHPRAGALGPRPAPATRPFALIDRDLVDENGQPHRIRLGLLGFLPPGSITGLHDGPFAAEVRDIVDTAKVMVPQLRALGADLVIVLAHSGFGAPDHQPGMENALLPLAKVAGIDAIVAGHTHQVFPDPTQVWPEGVDGETGHINGIPVVMPGFWGSHLGEIDLTLAPDTSGLWKPSGATVRARRVGISDPVAAAPATSLKPDRAVVNMLERMRRKVAEKSKVPVGETRLRLHSYFAVVMPSTALDVIHRAKLWWGAREVAGTDLEHLPLVASAAAFKTGGFAGPRFFTDIPPGPITERDLIELYLYPNDICVVRLSALELQNWLERAASVFRQIRPGQKDQPLIAPATPVYHYETLAGCHYKIDLSAPARFDPSAGLQDRNAGRIRDLSIDGRTLAPEDEVLLLTTTYRVNGGGDYPVIDPARIVRNPGIRVRDVIAEYLSAHGLVGEPPLARWQFSPVRGATAIFQSAPQAGETLDPRQARLLPGEVSPDGFRSYRLALDSAVSYMPPREVGAGRRLANPVRSGRKQP